MGLKISEFYWILQNYLLHIKMLKFDSKFLDFAKFHPGGTQLWKWWDGRQTRNYSFNFGLNFDCNWKLLNFTKFHSSHVVGGQKCMFFKPKFSTRLKISGFCQISSFADSEWLKLTILIKILNATKNFWILLNFTKFPPSHLPSGQKCPFLTNFQRNSKFPDFAQFHPLQVLSGQKSHFNSNLEHNLKFLDFAKFRILRMSWVVKNLNFGQNFQHDSKFLDFAKFHPLQVRPCRLVKNFFFEPNFQRCSKFLDFTKFYSFAGPSKLSILSQIFKASQKF